MLKSITRNNHYGYHGSGIMKISHQKLQMKQEENNASSGYSSSVCDLQLQHHSITVSSPPTTHTNNTLTPPQAAEAPVPSPPSAAANTSPQVSEFGDTVNSGGSGTILKLPNNVNNTTSPRYNNHHHNNTARSIGGHTTDDSTTMLSHHNHHHNNGNSNHKHTRCISPSYSCCQKNEMLARLNEELLQQKRDLEEHNRSLSEEIQVSRRFYQGTLADLTAQLSLAENRIKYLKEVVSTQEEALQHHGKEQGVRSNVINQQDNLQHFTQPPSISGVLKTSKSLPTSPRGGYLESARSVASSTGSSGSEMSSSRSRLNVKNFAKMKEQLLEKNQNLKTDIELLKFKSEVPRSASVPALNIRSSQEFPSIKTTGRRTEWVSSSQILEDSYQQQQQMPSMEQRRQDVNPKYIVPQITQEVRAEQKKKVKNRMK